MSNSFRAARVDKAGVPAVSVIIPTYNRAHLVARAIRSVLNQSFQDFEIIVVDDGSTDNTEEIVRGFNDSRIRYIRHARNRRAAAAWNTGTKAAQGELIAFQDSDDEWLPEKLEKQMKVFESASSKVGVVYTGLWRVQDGKKTYIPSSKIPQKEGDIHDTLLKGNFVGTPSAVIKKECFEKAGMFYEQLPRLIDWELFIRISKSYEFKYVDEPLVISYFTPESLSADQDALIKALKLILERHFQDFRRNRRYLASYQYSLGNLLCQRGGLDQGRGYLLKAMKSYPLNIKYLTAFLVSFFGEKAYNKVVKLRYRIRGNM